MIKQLLPFLFLILVGCSKEEKELLSSNKSIASVIFKMSDNPGLSADITGVVSSDSIRFEVPQNTAVNSLIPAIDFSGKKIEPANRTAQDFTSGVKYTVTAEDGSTHSYVFRVTRISSDTSTLVLGTWKVIKDSVTNNNWINPAGAYLLPGVYVGTSLDYWKFETNGVFSGRENNITGTSTYSITPNNKLDIPVWSVQYGLGTIETLTRTAFTVYFSATSSNGGQYFRKVYLKR
jgi:hypothetical protein